MSRVQRMQFDRYMVCPSCEKEITVELYPGSLNDFYCYDCELAVNGFTKSKHIYSYVPSHVAIWDQIGHTRIEPLKLHRRTPNHLNGNGQPILTFPHILPYSIHDLEKLKNLANLL